MKFVTAQGQPLVLGNLHGRVPMKMPAFVAALGAALLLPAGMALACDDHHGVCEIEDWKHTYTPMLEAIQIDGVATCDTGRIRLRLYDGEGDGRKFIGVESAFIKGHIFKAVKLQAAKPAALSIKYSIEPK